MSARPDRAVRKPLPPSFFERNVKHIVNAVYVVCGLLLVADLVYHFVGHKHVHFDIEAWPGFYAAAGFVSYIALVLTAKQLRRVVMRPEDYYGPVPDAPEPPIPHTSDSHGADSHGADSRTSSTPSHPPAGRAEEEE